MLIRTILRVFSTVPQVAPGKTILPLPAIPEYHLSVHDTPQLPKVIVRSHNLLLKNWWSETPFERKSPLVVPVFGLKTGEFTGKAVELSQEIFNQPMRRDLIYRLYHWRIMLNKFRTNLTRNITRTAGSGKKPRAQKGTGSARLGKIKAPGRFGGGKAHGAKPKVYSFHVNEKIKLNALRALLSSKLFEGKIRIIDSEELEQPKTNLLAKYVDKNLPKRATACLIVSAEPNENIDRAHKNIERIKCYTSRNFDVLDIMKLDRVLITKKGLKEMTDNILKTLYEEYRTQIVLLNSAKQEQEQQQPEEQFDPTKPLTFKFKILEDYLKLYEQTKKSKPQLLEKQIAKTTLGKKQQQSSNN